MPCMHGFEFSKIIGIRIMGKKVFGMLAFNITNGSPLFELPLCA